MFDRKEMHKVLIDPLTWIPKKCPVQSLQNARLKEQLKIYIFYFKVCFYKFTADPGLHKNPATICCLSKWSLIHGSTF